VLEGRWEFGAVWYKKFSPNGDVLVAGGEDVAQLWDMKTYEQLPDLEGYDDTHYIAFSPDGTILAGANAAGNTVQVWEVLSGARLKALELGVADTSNSWDVDLVTNIRDITFSPDGNLLVAGGGNSVELWDTSTGETLALLRDDWVTDVEFSPDGTLLATGSRHGVELWSVNSRGDTTTVESLRVMNGHPGYDLVFSPDGTTLATLDTESHAAGLWDVGRGNLSAVLSGQEDAHLCGVEFSPDGSLVIAGNIIWDVTTEEQLIVFQEAHWIWLSPDGQYLSVMTDDEIQTWGVSGEE
jgi:WD40 repeat protein